VVLPWPCDNGFTLQEFLFFTRNVKQSLAAQDEIDLIRFRVAVNALILARFQTINVAEIFRRFENRHFLHFFTRETDQILKPSNFHSRVRLIVVEHAREERKEISRQVAKATEGSPSRCYFFI